MKTISEYIEIGIKTTMIGALGVFEEFFGCLWGGSNGPSTEEEEHWKAIWDEAREKILDRGHSSLSKTEAMCKKVLDMQDIKNSMSKRYHYRVTGGMKNDKYRNRKR